MEEKFMIVYHWIRRWIDQNKFSDQQKIPSENMLCLKLNVSRQTVRRAIGLLCEEKLLCSVRGSGTYINKAEALSHDLRKENARVKIALILQGQDRNANSTLIKGVREVLANSETDLQLFFTDNRFINERRCLESIISQHFGGVIIDGVKASLLNPNTDCYRAIEQLGIPVIFYNNYYQSLAFPKVIIDDARSADALMMRLTAAGHKHIAGIFVYDNYQSIEKYKGYVNGLMKYGGVFDDSFVKWCISNEAHEPGFAKEIHRFLKKVPECTAIVCCNYMILQWVLLALGQMDKQVPKDYSLVCFDYSNQDWQEANVTCSLHPGREMGQRVGQRMLDMLEKRRTPEECSETIEAEIFDGGSICAPI